MNLVRKVAFNTIIQIISKIISTFLGLIAIAIMTRYLGSAGFGQYTTIITFVSLFAIIADLGLTLVTTQMINKPGIDESRILGNLFSFRLISALILVGLAPLVVWLFPYDINIKAGVLITSIAFFFLALNQIFVSLFQKHLRTDRIAIAEIASRIVMVIGVVIAKKLGYGLNGMLLAIVACNFVNFFFHYLFARKFASINLKFNLEIWKEILKKSWPLMLTITFNLVYLKADIMLLSLFKTDEVVGWYGAAYKVIDILITVPFLFAGIMLPILVKHWESGSKQEFFRIIQKIFDITAIIVIPLMLGGYFLAKPIILLVAGSEFVVSGPILQILLLAVGAVFFSCIFTHTIVSFNQQKKLIIYYLITALTALPVYYFMIQKWSYFGAAWGTVYSETLIFVFALILVYRYSKFLPNMKVFLKSIISAILMSGMLYYISGWAENSAWNLLVIIILSILVYFSLLYLLKGINKHEIVLLIKNK